MTQVEIFKQVANQSRLQLTPASWVLAPAGRLWFLFLGMNNIVMDQTEHERMVWSHSFPLKLLASNIFIISFGLHWVQCLGYCLFWSNNLNIQTLIKLNWALLLFARQCTFNVQFNPNQDCFLRWCDFRQNWVRFFFRWNLVLNCLNLRNSHWECQQRIILGLQYVLQSVPLGRLCWGNLKAHHSMKEACFWRQIPYYFETSHAPWEPISETEMEASDTIEWI